MQILRNRRLESIPVALHNSGIEMWIEGNPKMERRVLDGLRKLAKAGTGRIQDFGGGKLEETGGNRIQNACSTGR